MQIDRLQIDYDASYKLQISILNKIDMTRHISYNYRIYNLHTDYIKIYDVNIDFIDNRLI